jgi:hypothetical protein
MLLITSLAASALLMGLARRRSNAIRLRVERRLSSRDPDELRPLADFD